MNGECLEVACLKTQVEAMFNRVLQLVGEGSSTDKPEWIPGYNRVHQLVGKVDLSGFLGITGFCKW